jgi:hypothetical protein
MPTIELQVQMGSWQHLLQPHEVIRVYRVGCAVPVAELPVPLMVQLVSHYLSQAQLTASVLAAHQAARMPLEPAPGRPRPPALGVPSWALQEARKGQRAARKPLRPYPPNLGRPFGR